jgi:hypothetical protein
MGPLFREKPCGEELMRLTRGGSPGLWHSLDRKWTFIRKESCGFWYIYPFGGDDVVTYDRFHTLREAVTAARRLAKEAQEEASDPSDGSAKT